jgi:DNA-binding transcriptional MerR regulator
MKHRKKTRSPGQPAGNADMGALYTLSVLCRLVGVSSQTILLYQEQGLIGPAGGTSSAATRFDDETLRTLRRIEHLRDRYEMNLRSLKFTLGLLQELERMRDELRMRR